jgi:hypothetical protein
MQQIHSELLLEVQNIKIRNITLERAVEANSNIT